MQIHVFLALEVRSRVWPSLWVTQFVVIKWKIKRSESVAGSLYERRKIRSKAEILIAVNTRCPGH